MNMSASFILSISPGDLSHWPVGHLFKFSLPNCNHDLRDELFEEAVYWMEGLEWGVWCSGILLVSVVSSVLAASR